MVLRRVEPGPPVRVHYALTRSGLAFEQVAAAVESWGRQLLTDAPSARTARRERR